MAASSRDFAGLLRLPIASAPIWRLISSVRLQKPSGHKGKGSKLVLHSLKRQAAACDVKPSILIQIVVRLQDLRSLLLWQLRARVGARDQLLEYCCATSVA